ncbi:kinase-like domain-containing protein [Melampsora americana]|nr:kinase-like domain-containing protein [Melampsora americana]
MSKVESEVDLPSESHWISINRTASDWSDLFKVPLSATSTLNQHSAIVSQSDTKQESKTKWIAIKRVNLGLKRYPHDIKREAKFLASLDHPNIVPLLTTSQTSSTFSLYLPFYKFTLSDLLQSSKPRFTPNTLPAFYFISKHILHQLSSGLSYLHTNSIGHRDVGPSNVVFDQNGSPIWIDFGTAWSESINESSEKDELEFELGTMPYRAPELLFGSRNYNPLKIDLWSFGVLISDFFSPLLESEKKEVIPVRANWRAQNKDPIHQSDGLFSFDLNDEENMNEDELKGGNVLDWYTKPMLDQKVFEEDSDWKLPEIEEDQSNQNHPHLKRKSLFLGHLGDIGLVGSIFKVLGTPDASTWPESETLPDFAKLTFHTFSPQPLEELLPYTKPEKDINKKEEKDSKLIIDLISKLLVYQSTERLTIDQVLKHTWFDGLGLEYDGKSYKEWMELWN